MTRAYGIDFGTTNTVAAVHDASLRARPLVDVGTGLPHPSVVWYRGDEVVVGYKAKEHINEYSGRPGNRFIQSVKRDLGKGKLFNVFGRELAAADVAAEVFKHLNRRAESDHRQQINESVVTVPVYFDGQARRDLRKAARQAGIHIKTFVHEPFAAVIGYCCGDGGESLERLEPSNILVFDWGGGTLDITVARLAGGCIFEVATGGLPGIAGDEFDRKLSDYARSRFLDDYRLDPQRFSPSPGAQDRLWANAEAAKIRLSSAASGVVEVSRFFEVPGHTLDLSVPVSRQQFQGLIGCDVERALSEVDRVLAEARLAESDISRALLIGGSSQIPCVKQEMLRRFGARLVQARNADTVIAAGAAIISANDWQPYLVRPITVELSDRTHHTVFESGEVLLPGWSRRDLTFFCTDNRDGEARLILCEQQHPESRSQPVRKAIVGVPVSSSLPRPYAHERVDATVTIDEDLVLRVSAHGATQNSQVTSEIHDICFGLRVR